MLCFALARAAFLARFGTRCVAVRLALCLRRPGLGCGGLAGESRMKCDVDEPDMTRTPASAQLEDKRRLYLPLSL
jgi:hypothetical protein